MQELAAEPCVDSRCRLGEACLWRAATGTLYWLDISPCSVLHEWRPADGRRRSWPLNELVTAIALCGPDSLLLVSETGLHRFAPDAPGLQALVAPPFPMQGMRFNDAGCDGAGRLWTGTMVNEMRPHPSPADSCGSIYRFDADGSCRLIARGVGCPNTFAWSPDERTMYTADSATGRITACDFDLSGGDTSNPRDFGEAAPGIPDGSAMDTDGCLWNARWGAGGVVRFAPDGRVLAFVRVPADLVTSCAFGGSDRRTLFITTARMDLGGAELARQPFAGGIFAVHTTSSGLERSAFGQARHRRS